MEGLMLVVGHCPSLLCAQTRSSMAPVLGENNLWEV